MIFKFLLVACTSFLTENVSKNLLNFQAGFIAIIVLHHKQKKAFVSPYNEYSNINNLLFKNKYI